MKMRNEPKKGAIIKLKRWFCWSWNISLLLYSRRKGVRKVMTLICFWFSICLNVCHSIPSLTFLRVSQRILFIYFFRVLACPNEAAGADVCSECWVRVDYYLMRRMMCAMCVIRTANAEGLAWNIITSWNHHISLYVMSYMAVERAT